MSHRHLRDEGKPNPSKNLHVVSKCLAIVLIPKTRKNSGGDELADDEADETIVDPADGHVIQSSEVHRALSPSGYNGKELLQDFKIRNKTCYWNPSLVESIKSLEYKGFVEPSTILVTGADIHIENLRSAWGRRVLKAPAGFTIERIGDVNGIQMQVIPQTQFMPLPDALCSIIMDLNMRRIVATLDVILEKLTAWYKDMTVPSQQLVFDTLGSLIKERKVFHTGSGYFVVTPDTNRLQTSINTSYLPSNASWLPYHPMYVPVFQGQIGSHPPVLPGSRAHMRSISCQVTTIEEPSDEDTPKDRDKGKDKDKGGTLGKSTRLNTIGISKDGKEDKKVSKSGKGAAESGEFKRTSSIKLKGEKAKAVKDVSLKPGVTNQEKEKGEKTSIFSKIFHRKKKDKDKDKALMPPPPPPPPLHPPAPPPAATTTTTTTTHSSDALSEGKESKEKEYATFSAQFPPPEWLWYQQQLEKQKRTETWVSQQSSKAATATQSTKVTARPPTGMKSHTGSSQHTSRKFQAQNPSGVDYVTMSASGNHRDKRITVDNMRQIYDNDMAKARPIRADNLYESFRHPSGATKHRHHHHRKSRDLEKLDDERKRGHRPSDYDVIDQADITPAQDSNVYHSVSALSPVAHLSDESTYAKLIDHPNLGPLHSTPRFEGQNDRTAYGVEGHEARDRIYGPPDHSHKRKSHRSRRRQHRMYSYYGNGDDISYEYKGHLPNKNSSRAQSRDSGVNCVGLGITDDNNKKQSGPVYENTPVSNKHAHHDSRHQPSLQQNAHANRHHQPLGNHVHFEVNNTGGNETVDMNSLYVADSAASSLVYQSDVTNPAYNSVVYGSNVTDTIGGPSVMYHTITGSNLESSEVPLPQNSLQSAFYDESSLLPPSNVITLKAEINPKAPQEVEEIVGSPDSIVDVVGSPSVRELSGSSDVVVEVVAVEENTELLSGGDGDAETAVHNGGESGRTIAVGRHDDNDDDDDDEEVDVGDYHENDDEDSGSDEDDVQRGQDKASYRPSHNPADGAMKGKPEQLNGIAATRRQETSGGHNGKDNFVSDSGFSSPRNPDNSNGKKVPTLGQSNSASEHSHGHSHNENSSDVQNHQHSATDSSVHHHSGETTGSDGHNTNSDVYMATASEQHSGSANEQADSSNGVVSIQDTALPNHVPNVVPRVKQSQSLNSIKSQDQTQPHLHNHYHQKQAHPLPGHAYQPSAKVIPHPDVYNNNTANIMYIDQNRQVRVPLHPNAMLNNQKLHTGKPKHSERPRSVDLWRSTTPNELHKFEEEQLSKKYGVNGEFEVMGVL